MELIKFKKSHNYLDSIGIPRLDEYNSNVIIDRVDFTEQERGGNIEWREDGVYLNVRGNFQKGFMFNKDYKISEYGNPKFHLFECSVIEKFIVQGILSRYYFWSNSDIVTVTQRGTNKEYPNQRLELCSKCGTILHERNFESINDTKDFHRLLDLNDKNIKKNLGEVETDIYNRPLNWRSISKAYREEQNYTCEECGFGDNNLENSIDRRYMHVHHIDSYDLLNTHRDNLKCVCILCHYNQDDYHQSNFEKPRLKRELDSFVHKYGVKLIEIGNQYINEFVHEKK